MLTGYRISYLCTLIALYRADLLYRLCGRYALTYQKPCTVISRMRGCAGNDKVAYARQSVKRFPFAAHSHAKTCDFGKSSCHKCGNSVVAKPHTFYYSTAEGDGVF